jgi:hypothetical protein
MKKLLLALVALAGARALHAQPEFAYYGIALGNFEYVEDFAGTEFFTDDVSSYHLMVGYQFMEHLTVEGGYGKTSTLRDTNTVLFTPPVNFRGDFRILSIRLLGVLPFDNGLSLMGGIGYSDMKQDFELNDGIDSVSGDRSSNEPGLYVGAQYNWDRFAVRIGFEKHDFGDSPFGEIAEVSDTSLSFFYKL